jgi:ribose transport system substrate-binding protein
MQVDSNRPSPRRPWAMLALILVLLAALTAVACGDDDDEDDGADRQTTEVAGGAEAATFAVPEGYSGPESGLPSEYPEPTDCDGQTIGWQNPLAANEELRAQQEAVELEVERLGGETIVLDDAVDPNKQVSNMQQLLAQGAKAIGFLPIDPKAVDPVLRQAQKSNVPVLAVERTQTREEDPGPITTQIWRGRDIQAFNQATYLAEANPGASLAVIGYAVPVPGITYLEERAQFWAKENGLEVAAFDENQTDDSAGGERVGSAVITRNPDIQGIIAYNDPTALGAGTAARAAGAPDLTVVGLNGGEDGFEGVRNGRLSATFQQDSVGTGVQAARALCTLAKDPGADVPELIVRPPSGPVTEDNVDVTPTWEQQLEELQSP